MSGHEIVELIREVIDYASLGIEVLAVVVVVTGVIMVVFSRRTVLHLFRGGKPEAAERYTQRLARPLLLGLDLLVAGDLVKTVSLELTLGNISALALLVLVRTFLSWSLEVEIEGHWPWKANSGSGHPD